MIRPPPRSTLSLHDALPIWRSGGPGHLQDRTLQPRTRGPTGLGEQREPRQRAPASGRVRDEVDQLRDRKSTRLNSSHGYISYAVFCLKKKKIAVRSMIPNAA